MASQAHCAYCFDTLAASFERRQPLPLAQIEQLWDEWYADEDVDIDGQEDDAEDGDKSSSSSARPAAISRLLNRVIPTNSSSSTPVSSSTAASSSSTLTSSSSSQASVSTPATSQSSSRSNLLSSSTNSSRPSPTEKCPLFITWNTTPSKGKSLRGCIGTFEPQPLEDGLRSYALTAAFDDHRFSPIPKDLLPRLQCCVTLLTNFSNPTKDPMDWTIGTHGIRISFIVNGRRHGATYLPDVALEQGWTKEEAILSLMRKAGWQGKKDDWRKVVGLELVRYEGKKVTLDYTEYKEWKSWAKKQSGNN